MANKFLKVGVIAQTMIDLLFRELVIARTVWTDAVKPDEFVNALDDTVTLRVPARRTARTRTLRGTGNARILQLDDSNEFAVPVKLDSDIYNGAPITDEELDLDIVNFAQQVLMPQVRVPARRTARTRTLRGTGNARILQLDDSNEFAVPVKLDSDIYHGAPTNA